jgi:hypothetical protein
LAGSPLRGGVQGARRGAKLWLDHSAALVTLPVGCAWPSELLYRREVAINELSPMITGCG